ncbi:MAG: ABC transporter ATP-binding protein [Planctomycetota bacterium]|nr:ABC transporter ATP-binding protein [Planctomycetota bacterium]
MTHFNYFAKKMLKWRFRLISALALAVFSALGLGVGLLSLGPALSLILDPEGGQSLLQLAMDFNATEPIVKVPAWFIANLPADRFEGVIFILVGIGCLTFIGGAANFFHQYLSAWIAVHVVSDVRNASFHHVLQMELGRVLKSGASEYVSRIIRDAEALQIGLTTLMGKSVAHFTKGVAAFIVACVFDYRLVIIAVLVFPILIFLLHKIGSKVRRGTKASLNAQQELLRISNETVQGLRAVKVNTAEQAIEDSFEEVNRRVVKAELKVRFVRALASPLMEILAIVVLGTLAAVAAKSIINGSLDFNTFLLSIGSLAVAGSSLRPLTGLVTSIQAADAPADRLLKVLNVPAEDTRSQSKLNRHTSSINFENVTFSYANDSMPAIKNFTVAIPHGQRVAIVGPTGSGKTTLVSMLPRLLRPQVGSVLIDGNDISTIDLYSLREQLGVVTQDTVLFRGTISENIRFGTMADQSAIEKAAKQAHAHEFIAEMNGGYTANVYEHGTSLSGGQRQRLAIARALLRDPAILIFDEATSQIDTESERLINDTLRQYCDGRTVLLIAHRLTTVQSADRILVLNQGVLVGDGTHDDLLASCDVYQRLAETQLITISHDS